MTEHFKNHRYFRQFAEENENGIAYFTREDVEKIVDRLQLKISNHYRKKPLEKKKRDVLAKKSGKYLAKKAGKRLTIADDGIEFPVQCHDQRLILVTKERIRELLRVVIEGMRFPVGDIYSKNSMQNRKKLIHESVENCTLHHLIENISHFLFSEDVVRNSWDPWSVLYGEFNPNGLRAHSELKIKEKRPIQFELPMMF